MSTYQTEEEQVEAIKKWWKDNGKSVIGGVMLGLAVVIGLKGWQQYTQGRAETAAAYYSNFAVSASSEEKRETAMEQGKRLLAEYGNTTYAVFAALEMARLQYAKGDSDAALASLQWVLDNASRKPLQELAKLRMTRILVDQGKLEQALRLSREAEGPFAAEYAVIAGDIAVRQNDPEAARKAYRQALDQDVADPELVRIKLADLGE